jgi:phosphoenolpyruvate---glycerone phosphotransferase subunit DhaL
VDQTNDDALRVVTRIAELVEENKDLLTDLDSRIGDGDLGLTMSKGFKAAEEEAKKAPAGLPGRLFAAAGVAIARAAPSTMGTLMGTGFMRGGKALGERSQLGAEELFLFFEAFTRGIQERGKAKVGEKTILDVLQPVCDALDSQRAASAAQAMQAAARAAADALERTKTLVPQHGKAAVFREKALGIQDPGGTVAYLVVRAFLETQR